MHAEASVKATRLRAFAVVALFVCGANRGRIRCVVVYVKLLLAVWWCTACTASSPASISNTGGTAIERAHSPGGTFSFAFGHSHARCEDCHRTGRKLDPNCNANGVCHDGDPHRGANGPACITCHVPGSWERMQHVPLFTEHRSALVAPITR